jgi:hypothetical protein
MVISAKFGWMQFAGSVMQRAHPISPSPVSVFESDHSPISQSTDSNLVVLANVMHVLGEIWNPARSRHCIYDIDAEGGTYS